MEDDTNTNSRSKRRKNLTKEENKRIYEFLLEKSVEGRLQRGLFTKRFVSIPS